jgi:hypothetical protein
MQMQFCRTSFAIIMLAWANLGLVGPAQAGEKDGEIEAIVDLAVADWSRLLTCLATDAKSHALQLKLWNDERTAITASLLHWKVAPDVVARIADKTSPAKLMARHKGSAADMLTYCAADPDWLDKSYRLQITMPSLKLPKR